MNSMVVECIFIGLAILFVVFEIFVQIKAVSATKRIVIERIFIGLVILFLLSRCFEYNTATFEPEELEWIKSSERYPKATFVSNRGNKAVYEVTSTFIPSHNKPTFGFTWVGVSHTRFISYDFSLTCNYNRMYGGFNITTYEGDRESGVGCDLNRMYYESKFNGTSQCFEMRGVRYNDCIIADSINSTYMQKGSRDVDSINISKLAFSKRYGLIYYKLSSGEEFFREMPKKRGKKSD